MAKARYMISPTPMAANVPNGMDLLEFSKSPLIAIPAVKPVTAGKNMAKTTSRDTEFSVGSIATVVGANSDVPKKIASNEIIMAASIRNCVFMAAEVLINANVVNATKAIVPVILKSFIDIPKLKYPLKLSANPIKYKAIDSAVPT